MSKDEWIWTITEVMEDFSLGMEVESEMPGAVDVSGRKSVVLDRWLNDPRVDRDMASRVLREVSTRVDVHIGKNYVLEMEEMLREERLKEEEG